MSSHLISDFALVDKYSHRVTILGPVIDSVRTAVDSGEPRIRGILIGAVTVQLKRAPSDISIKYCRQGITVSIGVVRQNVADQARLFAVACIRLVI